MKLNIANPVTAQRKLIEIEDERRVRVFQEKRISEEVPGDSIGDQFKGYIFRITGGHDKQGFPMKQGVLLERRVRLLLNGSTGCFHPKRKGQRKRKSVRGCIVGPDISVLNLIIVQKGDEELPGLTDKILPRRLPPRRASKLRKLFKRTREDDINEFVINRVIKKRGKKKRIIKPKIQRVMTERNQGHARYRRNLKRRRVEARKEEEVEYRKLLAKLKAERVAKGSKKSRKSRVSRKEPAAQ